MFNKKAKDMDLAGKSEKKSKFIGALKNHIGRNGNKDMEKEDEPEDKAGHPYSNKGTKNMDKNSRKTLAISIMKKKMQE